MLHPRRPPVPCMPCPPADDFTSMTCDADTGCRPMTKSEEIEIAQDSLRRFARNEWPIHDFCGDRCPTQADDLFAALKAAKAPGYVGGGAMVDGTYRLTWIRSTLPLPPLPKTVDGLPVRVEFVNDYPVAFARQP